MVNNEVSRQIIARQVRGFCDLIERRMLTIATGHLIIQDTEMKEHDYGVANEIKWTDPGVQGRWNFLVRDTFIVHRVFVRGEVEIVCNMECIGNRFKKGYVASLTFTSDAVYKL